MRCLECLGNYYPSAGCETCRHPLERLFRFIGALGRLHVEAETDLRAAAIVEVAAERQYRRCWGDYKGQRSRHIIWCDARTNMLRLADEAVGLK